MNKLNLSPYRINHYSQNGEDGVIEKLFEIANIHRGMLIEFGAWDGIYLSNTFYHYQQNRNFKSMLIEPDKDRFAEMEISIGYQRALLLNVAVETKGHNSLNAIFHHYDIKNIALLSIDVDGEDFNIWKSLDKKKYKPAIVILEFSKWHFKTDVAELVQQFKKDGYNLVCVTGNFIFVHMSYGITSTQNVHGLMASSGHPDFDAYEERIDTETYNHIVSRLPHEKDIFAKMAGEQIINY